MWFNIPAPCLPSCLPVVEGLMVLSFISRGKLNVIFLTPVKCRNAGWCRFENNRMHCTFNWKSWRKSLSPSWRSQISCIFKEILVRATVVLHLQSRSSLADRGICGSGTKLCCLLAACQCRAAAWAARLLPGSSRRGTARAGGMRCGVLRPAKAEERLPSLRWGSCVCVVW